MHAKKDNKLKFRVALTRKMSRFTGFMCNMPLPPHLRQYVYLGFGKAYGVNFDDILVQDLNQFRTFNQFFTREIKPDARQIDNISDH